MSEHRMPHRRDKDELGTRIKSYERATRYWLPPNSCVIVRVDGRAFHTFTRDCAKPFDHEIMSAMVNAMVETAKDMAGFKLGYTQSDEATFLLTDFDTTKTAAWLDYNLAKIVSLSASGFTMRFNRHYGHSRTAMFDSRAFTMPLPDAPNAFIWRQQDWERNSMQMLAHAHFPPEQLHRRSRRGLHDMLHGIGVNWAHLADDEKNGTFLLQDGTLVSRKTTYTEIAEYLDEVLSPDVG